MTGKIEQGYNQTDRMEMIWGTGFMSPGGEAEVARLLGRLPVAGAKVLNVGSGLGGADLAILRRHDAAHVTGYDVQPSLVDEAGRRAARAGLKDRLAYVLGQPGPLPFRDGQFDLVFTKDAMIHVADKRAILAEMFRVLRPGGHLAFGDWMRGVGAQHDAPLARAFDLTVHDFHPHDLQQIATWVAEVGFTGIETQDRNAWYLAEASEEMARLHGDLGAEFTRRYGQEALDEEIEFWEALIDALRLGALRPGHIRARKP